MVEKHGLPCFCLNQLINLRVMSESCSATLKTSPNGVQGLAMMAPVIGLPFGIHVLGGALVAVTGIAVAVAPLAVPLAVPFLYKAVSDGGFDSVVRKLFSDDRQSEPVQKVRINVGDVAVKEGLPFAAHGIQTAVVTSKPV
jgi:hypothetical protein